MVTMQSWMFISSFENAPRTSSSLKHALDDGPSWRSVPLTRSAAKLVQRPPSCCRCGANQSCQRLISDSSLAPTRLTKVSALLRVRSSPDGDSIDVRCDSSRFRQIPRKSDRLLAADATTMRSSEELSLGKSQSRRGHNDREITIASCDMVGGCPIRFDAGEQWKAARWFPYARVEDIEGGTETSNTCGLVRRRSFRDQKKLRCRVRFEASSRTETGLPGIGVSPKGFGLRYLSARGRTFDMRRTDSVF